MTQPVPNLPPRLLQQLAGRSLIVFDGECVLCSGFYRFVLRMDRDRLFHFATAQSQIGQALYTALALPTNDFETNLVITEGTVHTHFDSFTAVMGQLHWPWRGLAIMRVLPRAIKTPLYRLIARNRYRIFGRYDQCMIPDQAARARFIDGGWMVDHGR